VAALLSVARPSAGLSCLGVDFAFIFVFMFVFIEDMDTILYQYPVLLSD